MEIKIIENNCLKFEDDGLLALLGSCNLFVGKLQFINLR